MTLRPSSNPLQGVSLRRLGHQAAGRATTTLGPKSLGPKAPMRFWGKVATVVTGPPKTVSVYLDGSAAATPNIRYHNSYSPTVGDTVHVELVGGQFIVLDKLA